MWDEWGKYVALILGTYLLGSIPQLYLIGRLKGVNILQYEDSHIALWREVGRIWGFLGVILDFAKGVAAVLIARACGFEAGWVAFAGVAAVAGQMWSAFTKFDGEKGNSIGLAMSGTLATKSLFVALIPLIIGFAMRTAPRFFASKQTMDNRLKFGGPPSLSLPLGMIITFAILPLVAWQIGNQPWEVSLCLFILFVLILIRRVTAGITQEMRQPSFKKSAFLNRLLFDRSEI